ncbi:hypothetical protein ACLMAJ_25210 [Nocardia sp. KC 131]
MSERGERSMGVAPSGALEPGVGVRPRTSSQYVSRMTEPSEEEL